MLCVPLELWTFFVIHSGHNSISEERQEFGNPIIYFTLERKQLITVAKNFFEPIKINEMF